MVDGNVPLVPIITSREERNATGARKRRLKLIS
jgi:hypothetical protein